MHCTAELPALNMPGTQTEHSAAPAPEKSRSGPLCYELRTGTLFEFKKRPANLLDGHWLQVIEATAPATVEYRPGAQRMQVFEPVAAIVEEYLPASHSVQEVNPEIEE